MCLFVQQSDLAEHRDVAKHLTRGPEQRYLRFESLAPSNPRVLETLRTARWRWICVTSSKRAFQGACACASLEYQNQLGQLIAIPITVA